MWACFAKTRRVKCFMRACNGKWAQKEVWRGKKEYCSGNSQIDRPIIQKQYHKECFAGSSLSLNCLSHANTCWCLNTWASCITNPHHMMAAQHKTWWINVAWSLKTTATHKPVNYELIYFNSLHGIDWRCKGREEKEERCTDARFSSKSENDRILVEAKMLTCKYTI